MSKNKTEVSQVHRDYDELCSNVESLQRKREKVLSMFNDPAIGTILDRFAKSIEEVKETLVNCEKKDFDKLQGRVWAARSIINTFKGAYEEELSEAQRRVAEFRKKNELLLSAAIPERERKGEPVAV